MPVQSDLDAAEFADTLTVMSDDELFTCTGLKKKAKTSAPASAPVSREAAW